MIMPSSHLVDRSKHKEGDEDDEAKLWKGWKTQEKACWLFSESGRKVTIQEACLTFSWKAINGWLKTQHELGC